MRMLDHESLISTIVQMIHDSVSLPFLNFVNIIEDKNISVLVAPSTEDKLILLQAILTYLDLYTDISSTDDVCINMVELYNNCNLSYIYGNTLQFNKVFTYKANKDLWYLYKANFCDKSVVNRIEKCFNKKTKISEEDAVWYKIQMFAFASLWMDMNQLLLYIYNNLNDLKTE